MLNSLQRNIRIPFFLILQLYKGSQGAIMTEDKSKIKGKVADKNSKNKLGNKNTSIAYMNKKHLQLCAWMGLTVSLCVVVIMSFRYKDNATYYDVAKSYADFEVLKKSEDVVSKSLKDVGSGTGQFRKKNEGNLDKSKRLSLRQIFNKTERALSRCQENSCQIACINVSDIYTALHAIIKGSVCQSIDVLVLERQEFPSSLLKNYWLPSTVTFKEVIIRSSRISVVKSYAFNSPSYRNTLALSLLNMNISNVESGALEGLYGLKYLTITSYIKTFNPAILQPVSDTLTNLTLNAHLEIKGNENPFVASYFNNLLYLDLSKNNFKGSLAKNLFESTPNLKYLIITECQIQHIEEDAFKNLANKLLFVDLSKNLLTTLAAGVLGPILAGEKCGMINLSNNEWICNCQLKKMAELYKTYYPKFIDGLSCKAPHHLYGMSLDEVDFREENCLISRITMYESQIEKELTTVTPPQHSNKTKMANGSDMWNSSNILKMLCLDTESPKEEEDSNELPKVVRPVPKVRSLNSSRDYLQIPPPNYDFELELIAENNSVIVSVRNPDDVFVIWFSDQFESSAINYSDIYLDYDCMHYAEPKLIVGPLEENTTYTFCLLSAMNDAISPFNCLPLYVPPESLDNIWISQDKKNFTIGMLCLIFLFSMLAGALIAYFGIKTYPDLLEGSSNVLIVKKPKEACYVATISENEYQQQSSYKREKSKKRKLSLTKLPLPKTPPCETTSPMLCAMSVKDLESLSSLKSCSNYFEDTSPRYNVIENKYETPNEGILNEQCNKLQNFYHTTLKTPPPLPKRNSNVSDSSTLVLNRLSNN